MLYTPTISAGGGSVFWQQLFRTLRPKIVCQSLAVLDFAILSQEGIENYIIDVDNTLALRKVTTCDSLAKMALQQAIEAGYIKRLVLVSNVGLRSSKRHKRVEQIAGELQAPFVCAYFPWIKPHPLPFKKGLSLMPGALPSNTAVIGDQMFSDIKGGNKLQLFTVYVVPLGPDHWITGWKRALEKMIFYLTQWRQ